MDRNIFKYNDGIQDRFGDPIALHRNLVLALRAQGGDLAEVCSLARTHDDQGNRVRPDIQAAEYQGYLLSAFRQAFELADFKPMTGEGVLDEQVWIIVDEFFTWEAKKKASIAPLADVCAAFGIPWIISYEEFVGLWLNAPRGLKQLANAVREGQEAAGGISMLGDAWGDAMARFDEEADLITFNLNSQRSYRKAMQDLAAGRMPGI